MTNIRPVGENHDQYVFYESEAPRFSHQQVSYLEQLYPPRCRSLQETERAHERYAGAAGLVQKLRQLEQRQRAKDVHMERVAGETVGDDQEGPVFHAGPEQVRLRAKPSVPRRPAAR